MTGFWEIEVKEKKKKKKNWGWKSVNIGIINLYYPFFIYFLSISQNPADPESFSTVNYLCTIGDV